MLAGLGFGFYPQVGFSLQENPCPGRTALSLPIKDFPISIVPASFLPLQLLPPPAPASPPAPAEV